MKSDPVTHLLTLILESNETDKKTRLRPHGIGDTMRAE